jgi:flagellar FliL protein
MSEEEEAVAEPAEVKKKPVLLIGVLAACAIAGGGAGVFVAAPMLLGSPTAEAGTGGTPAKSHGGGGHGKSSGPPIFAVDNLVLNPSGTNGTRFLMVSAAFELSDDGMIDQMRGREPEIRDLLNRTFGSRTVEELTDLQRREPIREDLRVALDHMFYEGAVVKVYLPQFVIQ